MARLPNSAKLFSGLIMHFAREAAGTSDAVTRPVSGSNLWLELAGINSSVKKLQRTTELYDEMGPDGWETGKDEYTTGTAYEITTRYTTSLYEELENGLAAAIVIGTAQTPEVKRDRTLRGWVNLQERQHDGQDRWVGSYWVEIRAMDPPAKEKKTQEPKFEIWIKRSTLNSLVWPAQP